jgi:hypothetical protein
MTLPKPDYNPPAPELRVEVRRVPDWHAQRRWEVVIPVGTVDECIFERANFDAPRFLLRSFLMDIADMLAKGASVRKER